MYFFKHNAVAKSILITAMCLVFTSACQTTNTGFATEREVDISETRIELPQELYDLKGFKIKKVMVKEDGSYRREVVNFTGGGFSFDRYFLGGILKMNEDKFRKTLTKYYPGYKVLSPITKSNFKIGDIYHVTIQDKDRTCFVISGNYGTAMMLRGGMGYPGVTNGEYCEPGEHPKLGEKVLPWVKKIRLR